MDTFHQSKTKVHSTYTSDHFIVIKALEYHYLSSYVVLTLTEKPVHPQRKCAWLALDII